MARGRPTAFNERKAQEIINRLRNGIGRRAACSGIVHYTTFLAWLKKGEKEGKGAFTDFLDGVTRAEGDAEIRHVTNIQRHAVGLDKVTRHETTATVIKMKKTRYPDGSVVEEPVAIEQKTVQVITSHETDWRASEAWLKAMRRAEWGPSLDITKLPDEELLRLYRLAVEAEGGDR